MATTARKAYAVAVMEKAKQEDRGYGARVAIINECPDCGGIGVNCGTCDNESDDKSLVKRGKFHYKPLK